MATRSWPISVLSLDNDTMMIIHSLIRGGVINEDGDWIQQERFVNISHILFKVLRPPFCCRSVQWIDFIQPEHNVCNFYHNLPVIVSSEVKHKWKVSDAIILYIRVSAFPRVRTVAGNVCAEKTCEGISFGICTLKDAPLQKHSRLLPEEWKMETQIVHTHPLVSDSSLYSPVMWYDMFLKVQRTKGKVGQGWQVHHVQ